MRQVNDATFKSDIEDAELAMVMFSAPWAGPCNMVRPTFEEIAKRYGNEMTFGEFNLDDNPATPERLGVKQVPVFYLMRRGIPETVIAGAVPDAVLVGLCEEALDD